MSHRLRTTLIVLATLALAAVTLSAPAQAASGGVRGVVSADGKPVKGLKVQLRQSTDDGDVYEPIASDTTTSKGAYSFSGFPTGETYRYDVLVTDPTSTVVTTRRSFEDRNGTTVTRNVTVKKAATLTGRVTREDGASPTAIRVHLEGPSDEIGTPDTTILSYADVVKPAADGTFTAKGLPPGSYDFSFVDTSKTYDTQCYDDVPFEHGGLSCSPEETPGATTTTISAGATQTLTPQTMTHESNRLTGTVTDTAGYPLPGIRLVAVADNGKTPYEQAFSQSGTGNFRVAQFPDGRYRVLAEPVSDEWARQYVDGSPGRAGATTFDLAGGESVTGIEVRLKSRAEIAAVLTPGAAGTAKVAVDVTRVATGSKPSGTVLVRWGDVQKSVTLVEGRGTATLAGLPTGKRQITVAYSGTSSTAAASKIFYVTVA